MLCFSDLNLKVSKISKRKKENILKFARFSRIRVEIRVTEAKYWIRICIIWIRVGNTDRYYSNYSHAVLYSTVYRQLTRQRLKLFFVSDFREKFTNCSSRLLQLKSVGIFAISFSVTEVWHFFILVFLTVWIYLLNKPCQFFTVHS